MSKPFSLIAKKSSITYTNPNSHTASLQSDLLYNIKLQTHQFGWGFSEINSLCEWIVDSPPESDIDDHWMNIRDY